MTIKNSILVTFNGSGEKVLDIIAGNLTIQPSVKIRIPVVGDTETDHDVLSL